MHGHPRRGDRLSVPARTALRGSRRAATDDRVGALLGAFVMAPVVLYLGLAGTVLYAAPGPLVPALNSYWIKIHVVAAITATGAFMVSGVVTLLYLLKERWERGQPPLRVSLLARLRSPLNPQRVSLGPGTAAVARAGRRARRADAVAAERRRRSTGWPTASSPSRSRSGRSRSSPARSGPSRRGAATGAGTPRRPGRSSPGWATRRTCMPGRLPAGAAVARRRCH